MAVLTGGLRSRNSVARFKSGMLRLVQLLLYLGRVFRVRLEFEVFGISLGDRLRVVLLFRGIAEAQPCLCEGGIPLCGFAEAGGGGAIAALLEVIVACANFLLGLERVEGIDLGRRGGVFVRRRRLFVGLRLFLLG